MRRYIRDCAFCSNTTIDGHVNGYRWRSTLEKLSTFILYPNGVRGSKGDNVNENGDVHNHHPSRINMSTESQLSCVNGSFSQGFVLR